MKRIIKIRLIFLNLYIIGDFLRFPYLLYLYSFLNLDQPFGRLAYTLGFVRWALSIGRASYGLLD